MLIVSGRITLAAERREHFLSLPHHAMLKGRAAKGATSSLSPPMQSNPTSSTSMKNGKDPVASQRVGGLNETGA
jgi:hypothetical protein